MKSVHGVSSSPSLGHFSVAVSSIAMHLEKFLRRVNVEQDMEDFAKKYEYSLIVLMGINTNIKGKRCPSPSAYEKGYPGYPGIPRRTQNGGIPVGLKPNGEKNGKKKIHVTKRKRKRSERERERERARKENEDIQRKKHGIYSRNGKKLMTLASDLVFPIFPSDLVFKGDTS